MPLIIIMGAVGGVLLLLIIALIIAAKYRTVVPTNMVHIVNSSSGRRVYGKDSKEGNTYYAFPDWLPKIGVNVTQFPTSNFGVELNNYAAYDHKRLPFQVDVQAFFVMQDADIVSQRVSDFRELKEHLQKIVSGAVRKVTASMPLEKILSARAELSSEFDAEVSEQLKDWGVKAVNSIEFMNIQDATGSSVIEDIQQKEESRINRESREVQAENEQAAKTKEIEAHRKIAMEQESAAQQVGTRIAEKERGIGIANEQSRQAIAEQSRVTTEKDMEVRRIADTRKAEIDKEVAITKAEQSRQEVTIEAESRKVAEITEAQAQQEKQILAAQAQLEEDKRTAEGALLKQEADAKGIAAVGSAKATSEQQMQMASVTAQTELAKQIGENTGYQEYLLQVKQIEVNGDVGIAQAKALETANIQIVGGQGTSGGLALGGLLTGLISTDAGKAVVERIAGKTI